MSATSNSSTASHAAGSNSSETLSFFTPSDVTSGDGRHRLLTAGPLEEVGASLHVEAGRVGEDEVTEVPLRHEGLLHQLVGLTHDVAHIGDVPVPDV